MIYEQKTGILMTDTNDVIGIGYAGNGEGKNNPEMESVHNVGPLPKGKYKIGGPYDSAHTGKFTLPLEPFPENYMFLRSDFKIHGDSISEPGTASNGCIILPRSVREKINNSVDKILKVI
jgi:hypothetical protein